MNQPNKQRLEFQGKAARIQAEASGLVLTVSELFKAIFASRTWPEGASQQAASLAEGATALADQWRGLTPTASLSSDWEELTSHFDDLAALFVQVVELDGLEGEALLQRTRSIQNAFTQRLDRMNTKEERLLQTEVELKERAERGQENG